MKFKLISILVVSILLFLFFQSCKNNSYSSESSTENTAEEGDGFTDGEYCADIDYYYSKTGTNSSYTLKVEIENNELVKIFWPNGGWLDDSHFSPPDISDGDARFESDKGVEYTVRIIGKGDCNYSSSAPDEDDFVSENEDEICPKCGEKKYSWDDYCDDCTDKIENTCSKCGSHEYGVRGGLCNSCKGKICPICGGEKWSSFDDMCDDCKRKKEEEERKNEEN